MYEALDNLEGLHPAFADSVHDNAYCEAISDVKRIVAKMPTQEWSEEDEKIRKKLLDFFGDEGDWLSGTTYAEVRAWLEKQGEQKPVEWSEQDDKMFAAISDMLYDGYKMSSGKITWDEIRNWLLPRCKPRKEG